MSRRACLCSHVWWWFHSALFQACYLFVPFIYTSFRPPQIPSQALWDVWWTKWHGDKFFSSSWAFPCHFHSTSASNICFIYHRRYWRFRLTEHSSVSFSECRVIILSDKRDGELLGPQRELSDKMTFCDSIPGHAAGITSDHTVATFRHYLVGRTAQLSVWHEDRTDMSVCAFGIQLPVLNANRAVGPAVPPSVSFTIQQAFFSSSYLWSTVAWRKWGRHWLELSILGYDMIYVMMIYMIWCDIFVNCNWVDTLWQ